MFKRGLLYTVYYHYYLFEIQQNNTKLETTHLEEPFQSKYQFLEEEEERCVRFLVFDLVFTTLSTKKA
jgi:hypothetical protein